MSVSWPIQQSLIIKGQKKMKPTDSHTKEIRKSLNKTISNHNTRDNEFICIWGMLQWLWGAHALNGAVFCAWTPSLSLVWGRTYCIIDVGLNGGASVVGRCDLSVTTRQTVFFVGSPGVVCSDGSCRFFDRLLVLRPWMVGVLCRIGSAADGLIFQSILLSLIKKYIFIVIAYIIL